jgi:ribosomal protein L11 methyltransferase
MTLADASGAEDALADRPRDVNEDAGGRWQVVVYFEARPGLNELAALDNAARRALGGEVDFVIREIPPTDWVAKSLAGLKTVRVGRFLVHWRHDRDRRRANDIAIEIEAGQAFGTGHHGTTAGCLGAIDRLARSRPIVRAIDVGTGSGVLAIAIARVAKAAVLASDIDPVAVAIASDNVRANGVRPFVRTIHADGLNGRAFDAIAPADLIVANIVAGPLVALAPAIPRRLAPGGTVILSGLLPAQKAGIVATYRGVGLRFVSARIIDGWLTLTMERPRHRR